MILHYTFSYVVWARTWSLAQLTGRSQEQFKRADDVIRTKKSPCARAKVRIGGNKNVDVGW